MNGVLVQVTISIQIHQYHMSCGGMVTFVAGLGLYFWSLRLFSFCFHLCTLNFQLWTLNFDFGTLSCDSGAGLTLHGGLGILYFVLGSLYCEFAFLPCGRGSVVRAFCLWSLLTGRTNFVTLLLYFVFDSLCMLLSFIHFC